MYKKIIDNFFLFREQYLTLHGNRQWIYALKSSSTHSYVNIPVKRTKINLSYFIFFILIILFIFILYSYVDSIELVSLQYRVSRFLCCC